VTRPQSEFGFDSGAPNDTAATLHQMARAGGPAILHLGPDAQGVVRALSAQDDRKVTQVTSNSEALGFATSDGPEIFVADLDTTGWYTALEGRTYDVVIVADLLEHLRNPAGVLRDLHEQRLLADDGRLLISFANVAHPAVMNEVLSGTGVRLRWYTMDSMNRLLWACGYLVMETHRTLRPTDEQTPTDSADVQTFEYALHVQSSGAGPQLAILQKQLDDVRQRLAEAEAVRDQVTALLEEERAAFLNEARRGADELEQLQSKLSRRTDERSALRNEAARLHGQLAHLQDELAVARDAKQTAERQLTTVRESRSYRFARRLARTAHVFATPLRFVRRAKGGR
jgi:Methyltransferase domain